MALLIKGSHRCTLAFAAPKLSGPHLDLLKTDCGSQKTCVETKKAPKRLPRAAPYRSCDPEIREGHNGFHEYEQLPVIH